MKLPFIIISRSSVTPPFLTNHVIGSLLTVSCNCMNWTKFAVKSAIPTNNNNIWSKIYTSVATLFGPRAVAIPRPSRAGYTLKIAPCLVVLLSRSKKTDWPGNTVCEAIISERDHVGINIFIVTGENDVEKRTKARDTEMYRDRSMGNTAESNV